MTDVDVLTPTEVRSPAPDRTERDRPAARKKPGVPRPVKLDYFVDLFLLLAFVLDQSFQLTGLVLHEWIGFAFGFSLLAHITLHWNWVVRTTSRLFKKKPGRDTIRWINDLVLMFMMTICVASGILSSRVVLPFFGIGEGSSDFWLEVHFKTADLCLFLIALHVALNWRWVVSVTGRLVRRSGRKAQKDGATA